MFEIKISKFVSQATQSNDDLTYTLILIITPIIVFIFFSFLLFKYYRKKKKGEVYGKINTLLGYSKLKDIYDLDNYDLNDVIRFNRVNKKGIKIKSNYVSVSESEIIKSNNVALEKLEKYKRIDSNNLFKTENKILNEYYNKIDIYYKRNNFLSDSKQKYKINDVSTSELNIDQKDIMLRGELLKFKKNKLKSMYLFNKKGFYTDKTTLKIQKHILNEVDKVNKKLDRDKQKNIYLKEEVNLLNYLVHKKNLEIKLNLNRNDQDYNFSKFNKVEKEFLSFSKKIDSENIKLEKLISENYKSQKKEFEKRNFAVKNNFFTIGNLSNSSTDLSLYLDKNEKFIKTNGNKEKNKESKSDYDIKLIHSKYHKRDIKSLPIVSKEN